MQPKHWVPAESVGDVVGLPLDPRDRETVVEKFLPDSDEPLVVQHVERLVEDADQRSVVRPDLKGGQALEVKFGLGDSILNG